MALINSVNTSDGTARQEINAKELISLLQSVEKEGNIEIIRLVIQSILDELSDMEK